MQHDYLLRYIDSGALTEFHFLFSCVTRNIDALFRSIWNLYTGCCLGWMTKIQWDIFGEIENHKYELYFSLSLSLSLSLFDPTLHIDNCIHCQTWCTTDHIQSSYFIITKWYNIREKDDISEQTEIFMLNEVYCGPSLDSKANVNIVKNW